MRRREIEEDAVPSEAARGFCRRCAATHRLERTPRAEAEAHALMRRIRETGRIDFDSDQPPDPRFAVERMYEPGGGKMLGVLVAVPPSRSSSAGARGGGADEKEEEEEEEIVVLKAFSGQLYGEWTVPGWSPPLCGLTHTHPHYIREHARIKAVVDAAGAKAKVVAELEEEVKREEDAWDGRIDALAARLREERQARRATRREKRADERVEVEVATVAAAATAQPIMPELEETQLSMVALELETKLAEESRAGKRELARLRRERAEAVAEPTAALVAARDEMNRLRTRHRSMSHVLLGEIFESYKLPNFRRVKEEDVTASDECDAQDGDGKKEVDNFSGWSSGATLREAFVSEDEEKSTAAATTAAPATEVNLPCGCGDCCAYLGVVVVRASHLMKGTFETVFNSLL